MRTTAKLHEFVFIFLFSEPERLLAGKKFSNNAEVISDTDANFKAKYKSCFFVIRRTFQTACYKFSPSMFIFV